MLVATPCFAVAFEWWWCSCTRCAAAPAPPSLRPTSRYCRLGTQTASFLISSISCHPASSILRIPEPQWRRLDKNVALDIDRDDVPAAPDAPFWHAELFPESLNPLITSKGRLSPLADGHIKIALTRSLDALISRKRGNEPSASTRCAGPAAAWMLTSICNTSSKECAERNDEGASGDTQRRFDRYRVVRFSQRPYIRNSSAKGRVRDVVPWVEMPALERGEM